MVLAVIVLSIINLFSSIEFKRYVERKKLLKTNILCSNSSLSMQTVTEYSTYSFRDATKSENKSNIKKANHTANINLMVLLISSFYIIGQVPYLLNTIASEFIQTPAICSTIAFIFISSMPTINIFIYYFFNSQYRKVFKNYFKKYDIPEALKK
jgi:uncharacterized protein YqhQ